MLSGRNLVVEELTNKSCSTASVKKRLSPVKIAVIAVIAVIIIATAVWRFIPRDFDDISFMDGIDIKQVTCAISYGDEPFRDVGTYPAGSDEFNGLLDLLSSCRYETEISNMFPRGKVTIYNPVEHDGANVSLTFDTGNTDDFECFIHFDLQNRITVSVSGSNDAVTLRNIGSKVYEPSDHKLIDKVEDYVLSLN